MSSLERNPTPKPPLDLAAVRSRLAAASGIPYWRSLEELSSTEEFREFLAREFPRQASAWNPALDRRGFLALLGASLALAGLSGCASQTAGRENRPVRGPLGGVRSGRAAVLRDRLAARRICSRAARQSHEGRPTKIEGNPDHPASLGATDAQTRRLCSACTIPTAPRPYFATEYRTHGTPFSGPSRLPGTSWAAIGGAGLHLLTETVTSPTAARQIKPCGRHTHARHGISTSHPSGRCARGGAHRVWQPTSVRSTTSARRR